MIDLFIQFHPLYHLVYFFYGTAFLVLAASIAAKDMKGSDLKLADSLWLLVMFGITHGTHEWIQLYPLLEGSNLSFQQIHSTKVIAVVLLVTSYLYLFWFGFTLIRSLIPKRNFFLEASPLVLFLVWLLFLWHAGFGTDLRFLRMTSIASRNTFGLFGGALTAYALIAYSREIKQLNRTAANNLFWAGISFGFYAVFAGIFTTNFRLFPLPVPIEMLRGISAIFITYFIIKALNIFDIETRRKIELQTRRIVQTEKLTSLGQLAAGIAHEINNPLTNASLGVQRLAILLKNDNVDPARIEKLHRVEKNIDRASGIARELLQFSRDQEGKFVPVNVNDVIRGALTLLQYKLKNVSVELDLLPVPNILGSPGKLEQVFINILSNSAEAMPTGGNVRIGTSFDGEQIEVLIDDSGSGIEAVNLSRVFDPFFTTKEIGAGTGLGLSICYGIIRQHSGTIDLASAAGKGTKVSIRIPGKGAL